MDRARNPRRVRFGQDLFLQAGYTIGKSMSFADEDGWVGLPLWNWGPMITRNYAPPGYDRQHMFTTAWSYDLPAGKGKKLNLVAPKVYSFSENGNSGIM